MENYPSFSYPDSGDSSPHSREPDFENVPPPSWDDQQPQPQPHQNRVKFMVSYNGKIQPRSYDNLLSYVGGDTKILAVDRYVKFSPLLAKLTSLITSSPDAQLQAPPTAVVSLKYQLPGEDLDALISVTNDDDLDHMMHEYDRLCKASSKPARLRLFLFSDRVFGSGFSSISSEPGKVGPDIEPDRTPKFVDAFAAINQQQQQQQQHQEVNHFIQNDVVLDPPMIASPPPPMPVHNNVDFLFGLDNKVPIPVPAPVQIQVPPPVQPEPELVHEMNRVQISAQEFHQLQQHQQQPSATVYSPTADENPQPNIPAAYWQQQQQQLQQQQFLQQQVYMMHAPPQANVYQPPAVMQPPAIGGQVQANQGYYQVQRMQPVYSMPPPVSAAAGVRPGDAAGYAQVGYDTATGRQFYYAAAPPPPSYSGMTAGTTAVGVGVVGDGRSSGDGNVVQNVSPPPGSTGV